MASSVTVPTNDPAAEAKIAAAYATDPGASRDGRYVSTGEAINASASYPSLRFLVVGNKHDCKEPEEDFYPSPYNSNPAIKLAHPWQKPSPSSIGGGKDVMGGLEPFRGRAWLAGRLAVVLALLTCWVLVRVQRCPVDRDAQKVRRVASAAGLVTVMALWVWLQSAMSPQQLGGGEMSAVCYYWGLELHTTQRVPIGLIHTSYGGSAVEDWISADVLGDGKSGPCVGAITSSMGEPSNQWNGQIVPLLNTTIKGAIWYQGESNHGQNELYACRYEMMMAEWRAQWNVGTGGATDPHFPIGFVQMGPTGGWGDKQDSFEIRMGQTGGFGYAPNARWPHSFMAAAFDLANPPGTKCFWGCVHIFNMQAVAHRLAVAARVAIYGEKGVSFSGPRIVGATAGTEGNAVTVTYDATVGTEGGGVVLRLNGNSTGGYGFEATADGKAWVRVNATRASALTLTLDIPQAVGSIQQVRYAWEDAPSIFTGTGPCVFNAAGLPATPSVTNVTTAGEAASA
jgi:hypothetical protein